MCCGKGALTDLAGVELELVGEEDGQVMRRSDSPRFSDQILVLRGSAIDALERHLAPDRLVPVCGSPSDAWWYGLEDDHPVALDWEQSDVERFPDGRLISVERPTFFSDRLRGVPSIFRVWPGESILFRGAFVRDWRISGLVGLDFSLEWSDEEGGEPDPRAF